jgi:hypothetical protein
MLLHDLAFALSLPLIPASFVTGNDLWQRCNSERQALMCWGYIEGVADVMEIGLLSSIGWRACFPDHATLGQFRDVVVLYLQTHPESRHTSAFGLVGHALAEAFPCR